MDDGLLWGQGPGLLLCFSLLFSVHIIFSALCKKASPTSPTQGERDGEGHLAVL